MNLDCLVMSYGMLSVSSNLLRNVKPVDLYTLNHIQNMIIRIHSIRRRQVEYCQTDLFRTDRKKMWEYEEMHAGSTGISSFSPTCLLPNVSL